MSNNEINSKSVIENIIKTELNMDVILDENEEPNNWSYLICGDKYAKTIQVYKNLKLFRQFRRIGEGETECPVKCKSKLKLKLKYEEKLRKEY